MTAEVHAQSILALLALKPTLLRGNASEVMALAGASRSGKGVDSTAQASEALEMGKQLAVKYNTIVAITGAVDLVSAQEGWRSMVMLYAKAQLVCMRCHNWTAQALRLGNCRPEPHAVYHPSSSMST